MQLIDSITDSTLVSKHSYYDSFEGIMSLLSDYKVEEGNDPADMYNLLELMGEGYFGKVIKCLNKETCEIVAVKEIKMCENVDQVVAKELYMLDKVSALDPDADNIIRFNKYFKTADGHHCMEFELLDLSVDKFMKRRQAKFSLNEIRSMAKDLLISLKGLQSVGVMHTDVKPDNIMYVDQKNKPFRVKLIDFGVAIPKEQAQVGKIMQPLGYRAPEVTLGLPLTEAVDMWSLGCCLLEWYLSAIPFPLPDGGLIEQAMYGNDYFVQEGSEWRLKGVSEYEQTTGVTPIMDWYPLEVFKDLKDVIQNCHQNRSGPDIEDRTFLDLLQKIKDSAIISMPTSINGISEGETSKNGRTANQQPSNVEVTTLLKPFPGCKVTTTAWQNPSGVRRRTT
uniref:Protein kinase domain-containing protein n=1 Tax=Neogobius melanostomus TaxID=47308 RepID=A0A8C6SVM5_9GOBI